MYSQYESGYEAFKPERFEFAFEDETEVYGETESPFSEAEEMELALELLEISSEAELDHFLGNVFKKVGQGLKKIAKPLGGILKSVAKKALPIVGGALGSFIPIPGVGTMIGRAVGTAASNLFEVELEGMSQEEQELEMARRYVRLAGGAAVRAARAPSGISPYAAARWGVRSAAQRYAPGLYRRRPRRPRGPVSRGYYPGYAVEPSLVNGRWIRRGPTIEIPNCYSAPSNGTPSPEPSTEPPPMPQGDEGDDGAQ
ncbi:MAG TPA: hypothetical protein VJZ26_14075 [Blastocatellia bacterium]|nr:hypothetical protein [Blastocatellia bacterium]